MNIVAKICGHESSKRGNEKVFTVTNISGIRACKFAQNKLYLLLIHIQSFRMIGHMWLLKNGGKFYFQYSLSVSIIKTSVHTMHNKHVRKTRLVLFSLRTMIYCFKHVTVFSHETGHFEIGCQLRYYTTTLIEGAMFEVANEWKYLENLQNSAALYLSNCYHYEWIT